MNELRRVWGANAVSRWSVIAGALGILILAIPGGTSGPAFPLPARLLTGLASVAMASLILVIARYTWLRPMQTSWRPALTLLTFAGAGVATGASRAWLIVSMGHDDPFSAGWRIGATTASAVIVLGLTAIVVDHVREHRRVMTELRLRQSDLEALDRRERDDMDALAARLRDDLLAPVRATLARIRDALVAVEAGRPATQEAMRIEAAVAGSIRPLSHEILAAEPGPVAPGAAGVAPPTARVTRLLAQASRHVVRSPWIVTLVPVVLSPIMLGPTWGTTFLLVNAVVTWPIYALLLIALRHTLEPGLQRMPVAMAGAALVIAYAGVTALTIAITYALGGLSPRPVPYIWIGIVTLTAILLAATLLQAAADLADGDEGELREIVARIAMSVARIQQRLRHEYQAVGALLHGPVQGALLAVAASLEQARAGMTDGERRRLVADALDRMADVERRLDSPPAGAQGIDVLLDGVLMLWTRVVEIRLHLDDDARAALDRTAAARIATADVVAEALTNALRHGRARRALINISLDGETACIVVRDDGRPGEFGAPGMGSRLYDESSHEWSLRPMAGGGSELRVHVPIGPPAHQ